jgi:drug/metabolite transporter (DMT)-like permease
MEFFGEIIALTTGLCWAFTSLFFAEAGRLVGAFKVNKIRLLIAAVIYSIILFFTTGHLFPDNLIWQHVFWLGISGFIGFVIGDGAGFKAFVVIGPRLTTLIYASAPVMAALMAWGFLGERLNFLDIIGMTVTIGGIIWVVSERQAKNNVAKDHPDAGSTAKGIFYSFIFGFGQAAGLILSKHAMINLDEPIDPMEASFIRILVAMVIIWIMSAFRGQLKETIAVFKNRRALGFLVGGSICGPFLGVWTSLIAVRVIAAGFAATLNSTVPIWILPIVKIYYKEKLSWRVILGTIITVGGVALLMLQ